MSRRICTDRCGKQTSQQFNVTNFLSYAEAVPDKASEISAVSAVMVFVPTLPDNKLPRTILVSLIGLLLMFQYLVLKAPATQSSSSNGTEDEIPAATVNPEWTPELNHVTTSNVAYSSGGTLFNSNRNSFRPELYPDPFQNPHL